MARHALTAEQRRIATAASAEPPLSVRAGATLRGASEPDVRAAFATLAGRHEALRTTFPRVEGLRVPVQEVHGAQTVSAGPSSTASTLAWTWDAAEERITVTASALALDRESLSQLLLQVQDAIAGAPLIEAPLAYADYAGHQERRAAEATPAERAEAAALAETLSPHTRTLLAAARAGEGATPAGSGTAFRDAGCVTREVPGVLPSPVLLAVVAAALWRLAGREAIVLGILDAGRDHPDTRNALGVFERPLPVLVAADAAIPLQALAQDLASRVDAARRLADLHVLEGAIASMAPPFEVEILPGFQPRVRGRTTLAEVEIDAWTSRPLLRLTAFVGTGDTRLVLRTDSSRLPAEAAPLILDGIVRALGAAIEAPGTRIRDLPLAGPLGRPLLPDPRAPLPVDPPEPLSRTISRGALENPDAPAVRGPEGDLSRAMLCELVQRLARRVRTHVPEGAAVAVTGPRSCGLVVALVAALEAGATLVPIDPALPSLRRTQIARRAKARLVLAVGGADVSPFGGPPVIAVDVAGVVSGDGPPFPPPAPRGPAYALLTSGTTGEPCLVTGERASLAHFIHWERQELRAGPGDRGALLTGLSFDVLLRDLLLPIASGATLLVPSDALRADPRALWEWLAREGVTILHLVPSLAASWLAHEGLPPLPALRWAIFAGEPLPLALVERLRALAPGARAGNLYGPTETTLARCFHEVVATPGAAAAALPPAVGRDDARAGVAPVGRAIPGTQALVLTPEGALAAPLEPGQVHIRTPYRALSLEGGGRAFTPSPFAPGDPSDLLHATGDRGIVDLDGTLRLLGRLDDQVKILGVRVDPEEIAGALRAHPDVRAAACVAAGAGPGARLVAAAVTPRTDLSLRAYLAARLPAALVPAQVHLVDRLPLTPNGKVDRAALARLAEGPPRRPLSTDAERLVGALMAEVLGRGLPEETLHADASLLDLGGTSLSVLALGARLLSRHGVRLAPAEIFEEATIGGIARRLEARGFRRAVEPAAVMDGASPSAPRGDLPLHGAPFRLWFESRRGADGAAAYALQWAVALTGPLDEARVRESLETVRAGHEGLRSIFPLESEGPVVRVVDAPLDLETSAVDAPPGDEDAALRALAARLAARPFALEERPPFRAHLARLGEGRHVLFLAAHHTILDAWSRRVLTDEVLTHLGARPGGARPAARPALQLRRLLEDARARDGETAALARWAARLRGARRLPLLGDTAWPREPLGPAGEVRVALDPATWRALEARARGLRATPFMVVLAAWKCLLAQELCVPDVVVGSPVINRAQEGAEGAIACTINLLALRTDVRGGALPVPEAVRAVRASVLEALGDQEAPFERVIAALAPPREAGRHPLFDVLFNWIAAPLEPRVLESGLRVSFPELTPPAARFALTLYAREEASGLALRLVHRVPLFARETARRHLERLARALRAAIERNDPFPDLAAGPRTLPAPEAPSPDAGPRDAPGPMSQEPFQAALAEIWREELGCAAVGAADDFFDLGGHSLLAVRLAGRLRTTLGIEPPLSLLYEHRTLAAQAGQLRALRPPEPRRPLVGCAGEAPLEPMGRSIQARMVAEGSGPFYAIPRAARLAGPLEPGRLARAWAHLTAHHTALRARADGGALRWGAPGDAPPLEVLDLRDVPPEAREATVRAHAEARWRAPLDPLRLPPIRGELLRFGPEDHALVVTAHELLADCWTLGIPFAGEGPAWRPGLLFPALARAYGELSLGVAPAPPPADAWDLPQALAARARWLASPAARREQDHWREHLADLPDPALPTDAPRPAAFPYEGARPRFTLPPEETAALRALAAATRSSLFEVLLALFAALLPEAVAREDVCVGTPVPWRAPPESLATAGPLGNLLALRLRLAPRRSFLAHLETARRATRGALAHQELPFPLVRAALGERATFPAPVAPGPSPRGAGPGPADEPSSIRRIFSSRLIFHRPESGALDLGGATLRPLLLARPVAKHELTLFLVDAGLRLEGWIEHPRALFRPETIAALGRRLIALSRLAGADPSRSLTALLSEAQA